MIYRAKSTEGFVKAEKNNADKDMPMFFFDN
jgi:hypothetical protein